MLRDQYDYLAKKQEADKRKDYIPDMLEWHPGPVPPNIYNEGFLSNLRSNFICLYF